MVGVCPWRTSSTRVGAGGAAVRAMVGSQPIVGPVASDRLAALLQVEREVVECRACPRLVAWREQVAAEHRASFRDQEYWARPVPGLRRSRRPHRDRRPGPRRPRRQPDGPDVHRRPLGRLPLRRPPPHRLRQPADQHGPRRRPRLSGVWITAPVRCAPPANKPTPTERDACLPFLERELALLDARVFVALGAFGYQALCGILGVRLTPPEVRPRRGGAAAGWPLDPRQLPREPAEHLHRHPHRAHVRRHPRPRVTSRVNRFRRAQERISPHAERSPSPIGTY